MAEAFGDELFSVFEEDAAAAASGAKKSKTGPAEGARRPGKRLEEKPSVPAAIVKPKREAEIDTTENVILGKKPKLEDVLSDDVNLTDLMPQVKVQSVETVEGCTHEVALPANEEFTGLKPRTGKAAKEYPFILDAFQREAILCVDNNQSVLVSAHTSAGKTVCAEYAIALALREKQRVIFTSPIKALSNQKYREMYEEFQDVGLMTGDVTINPTASCLVMTTEVRQTLILDQCFLLHFLIGEPCHVIYTDYRPTPLQHYIFPAGGDGLHLVVDENGDFREDNFNTAMQVLRDAGDLAKGDQKGRKGGTKGPSNVFKIVKMIMERNFQPVIIFSFSKKDCEAYALQMTKLDFNTDEEKKMVEEVFNNAIDCLSDEDKKLPQVEHVLPLLKRGIGIHHGGLLPILKETIEILFSEGLIKALFATETFAMGINMPARTVLFTSASKFDGKDFRWISSGEYIQMSGRAGRRGMDDRGIVILMVDEKMSPTIGKQLLKGSADPLNSAFHLTYNMVLNLLRVEEINPEYMLEKSFYQFQHYRTIPEIVERVNNLEAQYNKIVIPNEENVVIYYRIRQQLAKLGKDIEEYIHKPKYCLPFLQPGRLVKVKNEGDDYGWGVVVNFSKKSNVKPNSGELDPLYVVEVLLHCSKDSLKNSATESAKPARPDERGEMQVVPVLVHLVSAISSIRLYIPKDLRPIDNRQSVLKSVQEVQKRFPDGVPLLDPIDDMGIKDQGLKKVIQKIEAFEHRMYSHPLHNDPNLETIYKLCEKKAQIAMDIKVAKRELKKARTVLQMDELKCRKRVLRRLGFATSSDVIEMKGRVACEISSADELLLTEMMFNGLFNDLSAEQATALLSCFVFQENVSYFFNSRILDIPLSQGLPQCSTAMLGAAALRSLGLVCALCSVGCGWAFPSPVIATGFTKCCSYTNCSHCSIIRCMRRLEELLRQMCQAAKAIGNTELENKFAEGITKIKRDIVFAASLYL
ncbi:MTREX helicase, partial [Emberiza fucata]|nr:MTREX helicase [Emberiza fucata]